MKRYSENVKKCVAENLYLTDYQLSVKIKELFDEDISPSCVKAMKYRLVHGQKVDVSSSPYVIIDRNDKDEITFKGISARWVYAYRTAKKRLTNGTDNIVTIQCNEMGYEISFYYDDDELGIAIDSIQELTKE